MKRALLLLTFCCVLFSSCEDNPTDAMIPSQNQIVRATVDGTTLFFDQTKVEKQEITQDGITYTDLYVTANKKNDASKKIIFKMEYMRTGGETCYYFLYQVGEREYDIETENSFHINVAKSTAKNIEGSFTGTLKDFQGNLVTINNGHFDITF